MQGGKQPRKKTIAQGPTDANGKFSFAKLEEGTYRLVAGNRNQGWIYMDVEVNANQNNDVGELKLVKPK